MQDITAYGSIGLTPVILLIVFILIAATITSVITQQTNNTTEEDIEQSLQEILNEISTYIQIKDKLGKYNTTHRNNTRIEQIALLIKPLISKDIDTTELSIKLLNGDYVTILNYSGNKAPIGSYSLFHHPLWKNLTPTTFGLIVLQDRDKSLLNYDILNRDMAYIIISLPEKLAMIKGDTIHVTLFPLTGIARTTTLRAPLPMKPVVSFE